MQPEISKNKKVKTTNNKKTKEKALVKGKIQENQRKIFKIKLKKKNENQRKSMDEMEEQKENLKSAKSMKTKEKA